MAQEQIELEFREELHKLAQMIQMMQQICKIPTSTTNANATTKNRSQEKQF